MPLPSLRYLDIAPFEHEGETVVVMRDPEGFVEEPLVLTPVAFFVASHLNGENETSDIQYAFSNYTGGRLLDQSDINRVVQILDDHGFLLSPKFLDIRSGVIRAFSQAPVRPAYLAGKAYPERASELRGYLDDFFLRNEGPRSLPQPDRGGNGRLRCLIVPHIDFDRGGHSYAHGYLGLAKCRKPDTVVIFGVAHAGPPLPLVMTRKHFETPFGTLETHVALVDRIAAACTWDPFEYEFMHRTEHSVEFQAVMLAYLYGPNVRIVPILCGPFLSELDGTGHEIAPEVESALNLCREIAQEPGSNIAVIAGADLAHVGRRFGDDFEIDDGVVARVRERDQEDLAHVLAGRPLEWYKSVMRDDNARRVCGLNCIYAALRSVEGAITKADLIHYDYAPDPAGGIVSFADIILA